MSRAGSPERLLRWYPPSWRARYGGEMAALMEDSFGGGPIPWRIRLSTAWAGVVERLRASGLGGDAERPGDRARSGSLLVLCAWAFVVVGGAMYAKFNENWSGATPKADRWVPNLGSIAVEAAAAAGLLVVAVAGLTVLPALIRAVATGGWALVRRQVLAVGALGGGTVVLGAAVVIWAHHLNVHQRNGGSGLYSAAFLVVCVFVAATIAALTAAAVSLTNRLELPTPTLSRLSVLALGHGGGDHRRGRRDGDVVVDCLGREGAKRCSSGRAPTDLVGAGVLLLVGLALAAVGGHRVLRAAPRLHTGG